MKGTRWVHDGNMMETSHLVWYYSTLILSLRFLLPFRHLNSPLDGKIIPDLIQSLFFVTLWVLVPCSFFIIKHLCFHYVFYFHSVIIGLFLPPQLEDAFGRIDYTCVQVTMATCKQDSRTCSQACRCRAILLDEIQGCLNLRPSHPIK